MTALATAIDWRWPPDSSATAWRTERTVVTESESSVSRHIFSMAVSSRRKGCMNHFAAQEHVGDHVEIIGQRQILVDDFNAQPGRVPRVVDVDFAPFKEKLAFIKGVDAGNAFDQRGLAGAVVADQRHDLARPDFKIHLVQRLHCPKRLGDAL